MGIYFSKYRTILELQRSINGRQEKIDEEEDEKNTKTVDEEPEETNEEEDTPTEYTMDDGEEDTEGEDNTEGTDNTAEEGDDEPNEYSMDDGEEGTDDGEDTDEEDTTDGEDDTDTDDVEDSTEMSDDEIKQMEEELFKSIPEDQMNIKIIELKKQYLEVYNTINAIMNRTNKIPKTSNNTKTLEFIVNKLIELKELVKFYMTNTFDTKSFIENNINYQQYLSTLNIINKLFQEIKDKKDNN